MSRSLRKGDAEVARSVMSMTYAGLSELGFLVNEDGVITVADKENQCDRGTRT